MGCSTHTLFIFLLCIGFLMVVQPQKVSGLNSIDLALKGHFLHLRRSRFLTWVRVDDLVNPPSQAPGPSVVLNPDQSSKRRVRRGSDPIHNRCWNKPELLSIGKGKEQFWQKREVGYINIYGVYAIVGEEKLNCSSIFVSSCIASFMWGRFWMLQFVWELLTH